MRCCKGIFIVFVVALGNIFNANAVFPEQYKFSLIDINDGLSHNQVTCFLKDSRGYLWVGTAAGLNRYDGYQLKVFRYNSRDTSSINANGINKLFEDPEGNIWVQTNAGISIYNPQTESFSKDLGKYLKRYSLSADNVENIIKDNAGNYWFIHTGAGITRYNPATKESVILKSIPADNSSVSSNFVSALQQNAEGDIWLIHRNGILEKLDGKSLKVTERTTAISEKSDRQLLNYELLVDSDDAIWVSLPLDGKGVFFYDPSSETLSHFHKKSARFPLNNDFAKGVTEASKGIIWVGTDHGGINVIDKKDFSVQYILHNEEMEKSLSQNSIVTLYKDNEGIVWIGTFKKGVNYYHPNIFRFPHFKNQPSIPSGLPYDDVNTFAEDDKGNLWIGTNGGGLLYLNRETGVYTSYRHDSQNPGSLSSDIIVSLLIDREGMLWVGTYLGGLNKFDGKTFTHYKSNAEDPESLSDNSVWELFEDSRGNIWAGTLQGGLNLLDKDTEQFIHLKNGAGEIPIHCDYISAMAEDRHGNIWIGGGSGIDILNLKSRKVTYLTHDPADEESLTSNSIWSVYRDSFDNMWVGTADGLNLYNEADSSFLRFTTEDGLPGSNIISILEDRANNLWLSTANGVSNLVIDRSGGVATSRENVSFRNYDERDGLQGKTFNENAALKTGKGEMIFGGANGFNIFYPESLRRNQNTPDIVFTDFQLFSKSVAVGEETGGRILLPRALANVDKVTLYHDENVFAIEFAALNFLHPEKNKFRYKLEGFDKDWHDVDNQNRRVTYTNLDPGEYEFKVLASNNDGVWNEEGSSIIIAVLAPFWKTNEAYALYIMLVLLGLYISRRRTLQKERAKFRLEQERREARQLHELDLMKIRFFTNVSHEFRTPISLILAPVERLLSKSDNPVEQKQYQMIHRNAKRLLNLVNQLLDFRKIEVEGLKLHSSEGNVIKFISESVHSFSDLSEKKNVELTFKSDLKELYAGFDMDKLEKILFNLLSNAFKFTPENGKIEVSAGCYDNDSSSEGIKILEIKVKDTGIGIPKEKHDKVFERFFRNDVPGSMVNQGSGIGLAITKEFVKIHGGTIAVESEPGNGSCFIVRIPVREMAGGPEKYGAEEVGQEEIKEEKLLKRETKKEEAMVPGVPDKNPLVLLVEDNEDFRFYLKDNLGVHFSIIEAQNGKEGWQKALSSGPDLIVSDLMMPEMNGMDLCKKIREDKRTSHIPFVLLTAHAAEEQKLKGLNIGANDYVTKPFNFEILLSRINNLISQKQLMQKVYEKKISVQTSEVNIVSLDDKLIQNAIKIVEENLSNPDFSVELLSRELGMSRAHLYKKMVAITGSSPVEFIRKIRLQRAAQFLEKSQLTVAEVAYKVGFNNTKYFTRYFKSEFNILPSLYAGSRKE